MAHHTTQESLTAAEVVEQLPSRIVGLLSVLHAADDDVAELTIGTLPFGSRSALAAYGIVTAAGTTGEGPVEVRLTPFGREVIAVCALDEMPREVRESIQALHRARASRDADLAASPLRAVAPKGRR
jgi:hypothetical protein